MTTRTRSTEHIARADVRRKLTTAPPIPAKPTKKKAPNEPTDRAWRYRKRGFPKKNEPKRTQTNPTRRILFSVAQPPPAGGNRQPYPPPSSLRPLVSSLQYLVSRRCGPAAPGWGDSTTTPEGGCATWGGGLVWVRFFPGNRVFDSARPDRWVRLARFFCWFCGSLRRGHAFPARRGAR